MGAQVATSDAGKGPIELRSACHRAIVSEIVQETGRTAHQVHLFEC